MKLSEGLIPATTGKAIVKRTPRTVESFAHLVTPEYIGNAPKLGQVVAVNAPNDENYPSSKSGFFLSEEAFLNAGWNCGLDELEKGSFLQPYSQTFGEKDVKKGIMFLRPRMQIIFETDALFEEREENVTTIIGSGNRNDNLNDLGRIEYLWSYYKDNKGKKDLTIRTWYYFYFMTSEGFRAHSNPLILSIKGVTNATFQEQLKQFRDDMASCTAVANGEAKRPGNFDAFGQYIFTPSLACKKVENSTKASKAVQVLEYDQPVYLTQDAAILSLDLNVIPDELMEVTKKEQYDEFARGCISRYGHEISQWTRTAPGVQITPAHIEPPMLKEDMPNPIAGVVSSEKFITSTSVPSLPGMVDIKSVRDVTTGEDSSLL